MSPMIRTIELTNFKYFEFTPTGGPFGGPEHDHAKNASPDVEIA